ncbi:MAG: RNA polymerase sigma-54 factor [Alteromonadaceae bacterium]|jgi:RNA polymerase sigma-54 factor
MRQSLQLRFSQQLTMTPQLQQAIRLLQLSTLDLQQEIQDALEGNPLLEVEEIQADKIEQSIEDKVHDADNEMQLNGSEDEHSEVKEQDSSDSITQDTISEELPTDAQWDDYISAGPNTPAVTPPEETQSYQGETTENIQDYLTWQMNLTPFSETDLAIAITIIEAINHKGFLTISIEEVLASMGNDEIELDEVAAVLKRVQFFEPVGVAARDLRECLMLQLSRLENTPWVKEALLVVGEHISLLGARDYRTLMRKTKLKEEALTQVMRLIHTLNPTPASSVIQEENNYVIPDVTVVKRKGRWVAELNGDTMPKLRVNKEYAALSKTMKQSNDSQFIKSHLQEAKWFIKSLESRNDTLLKVSNCILHQQQGFFEYGDEAMKPMVLNDVAEIVDMHESTISRVTTQKYMHTPRGIFELKYFFSSHVSTKNGGECSSTAIRALIKKLVSAENQQKPLSDSKIADILADQGIKVARRTIAKYRESLSIPPSNQRKSLL